MVKRCNNENKNTQKRNRTASQEVRTKRQHTDTQSRTNNDTKGLEDV